MSHSKSREIRFPYQKVLVLGIVVAVLGLGCILVAIIGFTMRIWGHYVGTGIWCGTIIFAAGISGVLSSQFRGSKSVVCYFVCSAIAAIMSLVMVVMSSAGLDYNSYFYKTPVTMKKSTFYCYVTALSLSLMSLMGNIASLFFCAQHNSFCRKKTNRNKTPSIRRTPQRIYSRASTNMRSDLPEQVFGSEATSCKIMETSIIQNRDETSQKRGFGSEKDATNHRRIRRSNSEGHHSHNRRCSQEQIHSAKGKYSGLKNGKDNQNALTAKASHHGYRSLPHRSHRRQTSQHSQASYDVEVERELLPTAFNEDELPSYTDALKQPPLTHHNFVHHGISGNRTHADNEYANDDNPVLYRTSEEISEQPTSHEEQTAFKAYNEEFHQNLRNEEVEMYRSASEAPSSTRVSLKHYINSTQPKHLTQDFTSTNQVSNYFQTTASPHVTNASMTYSNNIHTDCTLSNNGISEIEPILHGNRCEDDERNEDVPQTCGVIVTPMSDTKQAFTPLTANNPYATLPITIGSPRSAFRPVRRRSSQKLVNERDASVTLQKIPQCDNGLNCETTNSTCSNLENSNLWKTMVLPSLHKTDASKMASDHEQGASNICCDLTVTTPEGNVIDSKRAISEKKRDYSAPVSCEANHPVLVENGASYQLPSLIGIHRPINNNTPDRSSGERIHSHNNLSSVNESSANHLHCAQVQPQQNPVNLNQSRDCDTPYYSQIL